jgi:putative addiction module component (TIGR02574 family)
MPRRIIMSKATEQLQPQLDRLSAKERQELVDYLTSSKKRTVRKAIDEDLMAVLEKRLDEIRSGKEKGVSEEDFLAELRKEFP